jgi:hypothetical protein
MAAAGAGGLADDVCDREAVEDPREGVTVIDSALHQVGGDHASFLAIEVKTQETKNTGLVG